MIYHAETFPPIGVCVNLFSLYFGDRGEFTVFCLMSPLLVKSLGGDTREGVKVPCEGEGRLDAFARKTHLLLLLGSHSYLVPSVHRHVFRHCVYSVSMLSSTGISSERNNFTWGWEDGNVTMKLNRFPWRVLLFDPRLVWWCIEPSYWSFRGLFI